jgi:hypothetical protein
VRPVRGGPCRRAIPQDTNDEVRISADEVGRVHVAISGAPAEPAGIVVVACIGDPSALGVVAEDGAQERLVSYVFRLGRVQAFVAGDVVTGDVVDHYSSRFIEGSCPT